MLNKYFEFLLEVIAYGLMNLLLAIDSLPPKPPHRKILDPSHISLKTNPIQELVSL